MADPRRLDMPPLTNYGYERESYCRFESRLETGSKPGVT